MSNVELGLWSFPVLLLLIFLRMPIGLAMLIVGVVGNYLITKSWNPSLSFFKSLTYSTFSSYSLSVVPLFLLMGQFASLGGISHQLFNAAASWLGHRKGGVAMAAIGACAGFGAICGSSLATAATMGQIALPELQASTAIPARWPPAPSRRAARSASSFRPPSSSSSTPSRPSRTSPSCS
jgi:C4-dicarboxylate transporter DctM subunit